MTIVAQSKTYTVDPFLLDTHRGGSERSTHPRRSQEKLLAALDALTEGQTQFVSRSAKAFESGARGYNIPRYVFLGPKSGDDPIRIGLFAGIHGDEPEGVHALLQFLRLLARRTELAAGYCLFVYPILNPTGFEDNTRESRSGKDLNREFWRGSFEPEVRFIESELVENAFHGIISLHTDDTSDGFYGFAHGATLSKHLIRPALKAAEQLLPCNRNAIIDGFTARNAIIRDKYNGILSAPPDVRPRPFEIILETPKTPPEFLKESAFVLSLQTILAEYRRFIAYAPNL